MRPLGLEPEPDSGDERAAIAAWRRSGRPAPICECGRPAPAAPVRCTGCTRPLCSACSAPDREGGAELDLCYRCALGEIADDQDDLLRALGLVEVIV